MDNTTTTSSQLELFELDATRRIQVAALKTLLPTVELALFFGKVYKLDARKLGKLLHLLWQTPLMDALMEGDHSWDLQDYLVEIVPGLDITAVFVAPEADVEDPPDTELLAQLWESAEIEIAASIRTVANKLVSTLDMLPSKEGSMVFATMAKMNHMRGTIGTYKPFIQHQAVPSVLVILDVSGSMTSRTIRTIIDDVVGLSWKANASLAIVSNNTYIWEPGTYDSATVLKKAEYAGTHYETLEPLLQQDWGTVITIADYDSSYDAKRHLGANCSGKIGTVLDISLVGRPTYLAECVGQFAQTIKPLLISSGIMRDYGYW